MKELGGCHVRMMDGVNVFQCPAQKNTARVDMDADGPQGARLALGCVECSFSRLGRCGGPVLVAGPGMKKNLYKREIQDEPKEVLSVVKSEDKEELCRKALLALTKPRPPKYADIISPFRQEIQAAREAGTGWKKIAKVLTEHGYTIGDYALRHAMEREARRRKPQKAEAQATV